MDKTIIICAAITVLGWSSELNFDNSKKCQRAYDESLKLIVQNKEVLPKYLKQCKKGSFEYRAIKEVQKLITKKD